MTMPSRRPVDQLVAAPKPKNRRRVDPAIKQASLGKVALNAYRLLLAVVVIILWWAIVQFEIVNPLFVPTPQATLISLINLLSTGLFSHVFETLQTSLAGWAIGSVVGIALGVVIGRLPRVNEVVAPFITAMNALPRIALAPLFVLWFGIGQTSHIVLVVSIVIFIVMSNAIAGAQAVEREYVVLARLFGANRREMMQKIVFPSITSWLTSSLRLAWAYSIAGAVVGEMFVGQKGLGFLISAGSGTFNVAQIFAALVVLVVIAWLFDNVLRLIERYLLRWRTT